MTPKSVKIKAEMKAKIKGNKGNTKENVFFRRCDSCIRVVHCTSPPSFPVHFLLDPPAACHFSIFSLGFNLGVPAAQLSFSFPLGLQCGELATCTFAALFATCGIRRGSEIWVRPAKKSDYPESLPILRNPWLEKSDYTADRN